VTSTGDCVIIPGGFFRNTTGGGGAATISSLDDLSDVTITSPSSNQILRYDGTQGLWVNSAVTTLPLVTSINGITGAIGITAGSNITITQSGLTFTVSSSTPPLASASVTGVASFGNEFIVTAAGAVGLTSNYVKSINGATGAVTDVAKTNTAQTFTGLQTFSGGLSGNLTGAATLATIENTNAGTRYICMVGGTGQTGIFVDAVTTPLSYQPTIGRMSMSSLVVTGSGYFTTINSSSIDANSQLVFNGPDGGAFTSVNNNASLYFDVPNGDISFGDIQGVSTGLQYAFVPKLNLGVLSSQNAGNAGKAKFGINRDGTGWTASGYGIELGRDNGKMLRMVYTDSITKQSDASPTANATFELSNNGDLTIMPSGGDVNISGSLTVTGTGLSGNVVINNQLNVLSGATFAASTDVYFGGSARGLIINGGKGSSDIAAYGNTEINIDGYFGNGTVSLRGYIINMGDIDGTSNSTFITVDDSGSTISHEASLGHNFGGSRISSLAGITAASLYISGGATFDGNTTIGNAATDTTTIYGSKVVNEVVFNNGTARTVGLSWANGNVQLLGGTGSGATGVTAIYFTNAPATGSASITLIVTNGGNMTGNTNFWATNIKWPGGNKPTLTASGVDVVSFVTPDAGSTIYGFVGGLNFA